jgi:diguanylate cyclase (GGDEF)-like protein
MRATAIAADADNQKEYVLSKRVSRNALARFVVAVVFLAVLAVILFALAVLQKDSRERLERDHLENLVKTVRDGVEDSLIQDDRILRMVVSSIPDWFSSSGGSQAASDQLKALSSLVMGVRSMKIVFSDGTVWASSEGFDIGSKLVGTPRDLYPLDLSSPDTLYVMNPYTAQDGSCTMTVARSFTIPGARYDGSAIMVITPAAFSRLLGSVLVAADAYSSIIYNNACVFLTASRQGILTGLDLNQSDRIFEPHVIAGKAQTFQVGLNDHLNKRRVVAVAELSPSSVKLSATLAVTTSRDYAPLFLAYHQASIVYIALYLVICALAAAALRIMNTRERLLLLAHKKSEAKLEYLAQHDTLTGLPNRFLAYDRLDRAFARANRFRTQLAVMFIDLDGFKGVNDTLGHDAGDALLSEIARRMQTKMRETDTLARVGGDEFIAIVEDLADRAAIEELANRILSAVSDPVQIRLRGVETSIVITASIGIACAADESVLSASLVSEADYAMYTAKQSGKNRCSFYS